MHIFNLNTVRLVLLLGFAGVVPLHAVPRISEFVALNSRSLFDEDGDSSDWIEIENTDGTAVSMEGWYLTDDPDDLTKWTIPAVTLLPNDYLVIFASNKDRVDPSGTLHTNFTIQPGEFLALVEPDGTTIASSYDPPPQFEDISYGVGTVGASIVTVPVDQDTNAKFFVPTSDPGAEDWRVPSYDDSAWNTAALGYGWDTIGSPYFDLLGVDGDLSSFAKGVNASIFVRVPIIVDDPSAVQRMVLDLNWEDGVVGYLNGQQILSENAPSPLAWDSAATRSHSDSEAVIPDTYEVDFAGKLVAGINILAFQMMNTTANGSDILLLPKLTVVAKDATTSEVEAFFEEPTPGTPNSPGKLAPAYVTVDTPTRTFTSGSLVVALSSETPGATIRYTTDGSIPTNEIGAASPEYTAPLTFTENTLLRTRAYLPGALPGPIETRAYFRLESDAAAFTSNLPTVLIDSFGSGSIPSAGATTRLPMIMAIFEPKDIGNGVMRSSMLNLPDLVTRMGSRKRGSSSSGWPKNHFSVEAWTENDYEEKGIEPLGFGEDNDWILGSFYQFDRALIRNPFIYDISRQIGRFAARTQHVELWNNLRDNVGGNDYFGVYTLGERLDRGESRIDVDSLNSTIIENNFANGGPGALAPFDADVSGGYIFKRDRGSPTFFSPGMGSFVYVYPSGGRDPNRPDDFFINTAQTAWLTKYLEEADDALNAPNGINPETDLHFSDYIDVDSFIDHIMLNNFAMNVDWGRLSAFLHKPRGGKLQGGPIWDFDRNMGSEDGRDRFPDRGWNGTGDSSRTWFDSRYPYYGKVMGYTSNTPGPPSTQSSRPDSMQRWIDRWFSLRKTVLSIENINATVDKYADPLNVESGSNPALPTPQSRNFARWTSVPPNGGIYDGGDRTWTGEITHMKGWLKARAEWIDAQFPPQPEFSVESGSVPVGTNLIMNYPQGEAYYTTDGSDPRAPGGGVSATAQQFEGGAIDTTIVPLDAPVDYFIPTDGSLGLTWTQANFDASSWTQAATGVGWESLGGTLEPLIATNISDEMRGVNGGAYFRWEFDFNNAGAVNSATLNVNVDDGFIAYLNGVEIASEFAPDPVAWNSISSGSTSDTNVVAGLQFDISAFTDAFRNGKNVLAIHAMNSSLNGSDFLIRAGLDINQTVAANPVVLNESQVVIARVREGDFWGAPTISSYAVGTIPASAENLMVSEIMYHPSEPTTVEIAAGYDDQDSFEFIEFVNISDTAIDMSGVSFGAGVNFTFPAGLQLEAGAHVIVVSNATAFRIRYGAGLNDFIAGQFQNGTNLANSGERILILGVDGNPIREFTYDDRSPWPEAADGDGFSLVLNSPNSAPDHNLPESWSTGVLGGTPGMAENSTIFEGDPNADMDKDGLNAFAEYAMGTSDSDSSSGPSAIWSRVDGGGDLRITYPKNTVAGDVIYIVEISTDLENWTSGEMVSLVSEEPIGGGISEVTYQSVMPEATKVYMRLRFQQR
ncbi:CotH kinase family protein [bacterium]|nr:CotH kinase family protein [bacterium]